MERLENIDIEELKSEGKIDALNKLMKGVIIANIVVISTSIVGCVAYYLGKHPECIETVKEYFNNIKSLF